MCGYSLVPAVMFNLIETSMLPTIFSPWDYKAVSFQKPRVESQAKFITGSPKYRESEWAYHARLLRTRSSYLVGATLAVAPFAVDAMLPISYDSIVLCYLPSSNRTSMGVGYEPG